VAETVTVSSEALNNLVTESPSVAVARRQQLPISARQRSRHSDSPSCSTPTCLGGKRQHSSFLGGGPTGFPTSEDGQASTNAIFGNVGNSAPASTPSARSRCISNSVQREYGGPPPAWSTTKRGGNSQQRERVLRLQQRRPESPSSTTEEAERSAERGGPQRRHERTPAGEQPGRPMAQNKTFFFANYKDRHQKEIYGGGRANVPTAAMRAGDSPRELHDSRSAHGPAFSRQRDPGEPASIRTAQRIHDSTTRCQTPHLSSAWGCTSSSSRRPATGTAPTSESTTRLEERTRCSCAPATIPQPNSIQFESGNALTQPRIRDTKLTTATGVVGLDEDPLHAPRSTSSGSLTNYDKTRADRATSMVARRTRRWGSRPPPSLGPNQVGFPR
jgi:hypothetical protein